MWYRPSVSPRWRGSSARHILPTRSCRKTRRARLLRQDQAMHCWSRFEALFQPPGSGMNVARLAQEVSQAFRPRHEKLSSMGILPMRGTGASSVQIAGTRPRRPRCVRTGQASGRRAALLRALDSRHSPATAAFCGAENSARRNLHHFIWPCGSGARAHLGKSPLLSLFNFHT